ncbi:MAG: aldehyde dehydrogenase family protein [Gammaproteobacteria bacterium]|nr:aldehyde dehydrogenase family protein [Gammaproteobacteria bacterium]
MRPNDLSTLLPSVVAFLGATPGLLIDGRRVPAASGRTFTVTDPSSGREISRVPEGGAEDVDRAVAAARRAFRDGPWREFRATERERRLLKLADLLERHGDEFAQIESVNSGRTLVNTKLFDVDLSVDYLRYMAGWATKIHGETADLTVPYLPDNHFFGMTLREPVGVVGAITPWNVPLGQAIWKLAPALATGCTIVLKPAEQTPLTALRFADLIEEADFPPGVVNIVTGFGETAGAALVEHPRVDKISFTGSTEVGRRIGAQAAAAFKRFTLELGGKSPVVVLADADLREAIPGAAWAIFGNHGQNCCAGSRLLVHASLYDEILAGVAEIARKIRLGPGLDPVTEMGPLVSRAQQEHVMSYIRSAVSAGARVLAGGNAVPGPGCYVQPTVITDTTPDMAAVREEIFGPVLCAMRFDTEAEALARANDTQFGLGASIWTRDVSKAHHFIRRLNAGTVWVNTHNVLDLGLPFGGFKHSGMGHELGQEAIHHHTLLKSAVIKLG